MGADTGTVGAGPDSRAIVAMLLWVAAVVGGVYWSRIEQRRSGEQTATEVRRCFGADRGRFRVGEGTGRYVTSKGVLIERGMVAVGSQAWDAHSVDLEWHRIKLVRFVYPGGSQVWRLGNGAARRQLVADINALFEVQRRLVRPPGWYADPWSAAPNRYWNGELWTSSFDPSRFVAYGEMLDVSETGPMGSFWEASLQPALLSVADGQVSLDGRSWPVSGTSWDTKAMVLSTPDGQFRFVCGSSSVDGLLQIRRAFDWMRTCSEWIGALIPSTDSVPR